MVQAVTPSFVEAKQTEALNLSPLASSHYFMFKNQTLLASAPMILKHFTLMVSFSNNSEISAVFLQKKRVLLGVDFKTVFCYVMTA